jgi:hypothetical protein
MKQKFLNIAAIVLILAGVIACKKETGTDPIEIPFTEYSFGETFCQWTNLNKDKKVIVINSDAEMEEYVTCEEGDYYPNIDFSKNTLLLAHGIAPQNIGSKNTALFRYSAAEYELKITISIGSMMVMEDWRISILVSKIPNDATINLKTDYVKNY